MLTSSPFKYQAITLLKSIKLIALFLGLITLSACTGQGIQNPEEIELQKKKDLLESLDRLYSSYPTDAVVCSQRQVRNMVEPFGNDAKFSKLERVERSKTEYFLRGIVSYGNQVSGYKCLVNFTVPSKECSISCELN